MKPARKIGFGGTLFAAALAVAIRLVVLMMEKPYFFGGDTFSYVAFANEIFHNGFVIPLTNSIHFPSSSFIFPPIVPLVLSPVYSISGSSGTLFWITALEILFGSIAVFPVSWIFDHSYQNGKGWVAAIIYATFPPFIYLEVWGDLAQIIALFILLIFIYSYMKILLNQNPRRFMAVAALTVIAIAFVHDLTFFLVVTLLIVFSIYTYTRKEIDLLTKKNSLLTTLFVSIAVIIGSSWYLFHPSWISFLITGYPISSSSGTISLSSLQVAAIPILGIPFGYGILTLVFPILLVISMIYVHRKERSMPARLIEAYVLSVSAIALITSFDAVLFSRFLYFVCLGYVLAGSDMLVHYLQGDIRLPVIGKGKSGLAAKIASVVLVLLYVGFAVLINSSAHAYYVSGSSGSNQYEENVALVTWIETNNVNCSTIAAPQSIGYFIMATSGLPVIVSENASYLTQISEQEESSAANYLVSLSTDQSVVYSIVKEYHVSCVISPLTTNSSIYKLSFSVHGYYVYKIENFSI